jgi:hypothetical protein
LSHGKYVKPFPIYQFFPYGGRLNGKTFGGNT